MGLTGDPWKFPDLDPPITEPAGVRRIVLGGGCFWCTEAVYRPLNGVLAVRPGYAGDRAEAASYQLVSAGITDHVEVIEITYDSGIIALSALLKLFFSIAHDPTQINRQGNDVGRHYRSVIFWSDEDQRRIAAAYMAQISAARLFDAPLATSLEPLSEFYVAEEYHHDYAARNPGQPYIHYVARPKVDKLRAVHPGMLRSE